jgi:branched-chain amino acid aminotransferase
VITLLRDSGYDVREERIGIHQIFQSFERGELRECFGTGTAATVSHIRRIRYRNETIELPPIEQREVGPAFKTKLLSVMTGRAPDQHGWIVRV